MPDHIEYYRKINDDEIRGYMLFPPSVTIPLRVTGVNQEYRGENSYPVWVYELKVDHPQAQRMTREWDRTQISEWIVFETIKFCTETPLPIGVGDLFTPDLVPFDALAETDEERRQREHRESLIESLRGVMGFMVMGEGDDDD